MTNSSVVVFTLELEFGFFYKLLVLNIGEIRMWILHFVYSFAQNFIYFFADWGLVSDITEVHPVAIFDVWAILVRHAVDHALLSWLEVLKLNFVKLRFSWRSWMIF